MEQLQSVAGFQAFNQEMLNRPQSQKFEGRTSGRLERLRKGLKKVVSAGMVAGMVGLASLGIQNVAAQEKVNSTPSSFSVVDCRGPFAIHCVFLGMISGAPLSYPTATSTSTPTPHPTVATYTPTPTGTPTITPTPTPRPPWSERMYTGSSLSPIGDEPYNPVLLGIDDVMKANGQACSGVDIREAYYQEDLTRIIIIGLLSDESYNPDTRRLSVMVDGAIREHDSFGNPRNYTALLRCGD